MAVLYLFICLLYSLLHMKAVTLINRLNNDINQKLKVTTILNITHQSKYTQSITYTVLNMMHINI